MTTVERIVSRHQDECDECGRRIYEHYFIDSERGKLCKSCADMDEEQQKLTGDINE